MCAVHINLPTIYLSWRCVPVSQPTIQPVFTVLRSAKRRKDRARKLQPRPSGHPAKTTSFVHCVTSILNPSEQKVLPINLTQKPGQGAEGTSGRERCVRRFCSGGEEPSHSCGFRTDRLCPMVVSHRDISLVGFTNLHCWILCSWRRSQDEPKPFQVLRNRQGSECSRTLKGFPEGKTAVSR